MAVVYLARGSGGEHQRQEKGQREADAWPLARSIRLLRGASLFGGLSLSGMLTSHRLGSKCAEIGNLTTGKSERNVFKRAASTQTEMDMLNMPSITSHIYIYMLVMCLNFYAQLSRFAEDYGKRPGGKKMFGATC